MIHLIHSAAPKARSNFRTTGPQIIFTGIIGPSDQLSLKLLAADAAADKAANANASR